MDKEYSSPKKLEINKQGFIMLPMSITQEKNLHICRVALLAYLLMYRGLHGRLMFSIPRFVEWAGFVSNTHSGAMNSKVLDVLQELRRIGYVSYNCYPTTSNIIEINVDRLFVSDMCGENFSLLYIDEIEKIMQYRRVNIKDVHLNSYSILLVFAYLRRQIFRRPNALKPEERSLEKMEERRKRIPEAYATTYLDIANELGLSERTVSKAAKILQELQLIVVAESFHIKKKDGSYRTCYTMFANFEKREGTELLDLGIKYAHREMKNKEEQIAAHVKEYNYVLKI